MPNLEAGDLERISAAHDFARAARSFLDSDDVKRAELATFASEVLVDIIKINWDQAREEWPSD